MDGKNNRVYCILGDGECQEGQVWEAAMFAAARNLHNLIAVIDENGRQLDGSLEEIMGPPNFDLKFKAFGWNVEDVADGNDVSQVWEALERAGNNSSGPTAVILHTVKGKGWRYAESLDNNHNFKVSSAQAAEAETEFQSIKTEDSPIKHEGGEGDGR